MKGRPVLNAPARGANHLVGNDRQSF